MTRTRESGKTSKPGRQVAEKIKPGKAKESDPNSPEQKTQDPKEVGKPLDEDGATVKEIDEAEEAVEENRPEEADPQDPRAKELQEKKLELVGQKEATSKGTGEIREDAQALKKKAQESKEAERNSGSAGAASEAEKVIKRLHDSFPSFMRPLSQVDDHLSSYDNLMKAKLKSGQPYVVPGSPDKSGLLTSSHFTKRLKKGEAASLKQWIQAGAPDWSKGAPQPGSKKKKQTTPKGEATKVKANRQPAAAKKPAKAGPGQQPKAVAPPSQSSPVERSPQNHFGIDGQRLEELQQAANSGELSQEDRQELADSVGSMLEHYQAGADEAYGGEHPDYFSYEEFADGGSEMLTEGADAYMPPGYDDASDFWDQMGLDSSQKVDDFKDHMGKVVSLWEDAGKPNWEQGVQPASPSSPSQPTSGVRPSNPTQGPGAPQNPDQLQRRQQLAQQMHELITGPWAEHIPEEKRSSYEAFLQAKDSFGAPYITPGKPESSAFVNYAQMDQSEDREQRVQTLKDWISAGAPSWEKANLGRTFAEIQGQQPPSDGPEEAPQDRPNPRNMQNFFGAGDPNSAEWRELSQAARSGDFSDEQKEQLARAMQGFTDFWLDNGAIASHQEYFQHENFVAEGGGLDSLINEGNSSAGLMPPNSNLRRALEQSGVENPDLGAWRQHMGQVASAYKAAGAPDWNQLQPDEATPTKPVDPIDQGAPVSANVRDAAMLGYLQNLDQHTARNTRFFTLDGVPQNQKGNYDRAAQLKSLTLLLNNMHFNPNPVTLQQVPGSEGQVYALDMRAMTVYDGNLGGHHYGGGSGYGGYGGGGYQRGGYGGFRSWTNGNEWQRVLSENPYGVRNDSTHRGSAIHNEISRLTGTPQSHVRSDWFTSHAVGNFALDLVMPGVNHTNELEHVFGIDRHSDFLNGTMMRAGFTQSGVANEHRIVDVHEGRFGQVWWSYDFDDTNFNQNIYANPLGPFQFDHRGDNPFQQLGFQTAASEILLRLPAGGTLAVLADGNGNFANNAPENIAWNRLGHHGGPTIFSVGSGLIGHIDGMQPIHQKDELYNLAHNTNALPDVYYPTGGYHGGGGYGYGGGYHQSYQRLSSQTQLQRITASPERWAEAVTQYNLRNYEHYQRVGAVDFQNGELDQIRQALGSNQGTEVTNSLTEARTASSDALASFSPGVNAYHNQTIDMDTVRHEMGLNSADIDHLRSAIRRGDHHLDRIGHHYGIENLAATISPLLTEEGNHGIKRESFEQAYPALAAYLGKGTPQLFDFYDHGGKLGIGGPFRNGSRKLGGERLTAADNADATVLNGEEKQKVGQGKAAQRGQGRGCGGGGQGGGGGGRGAGGAGGARGPGAAGRNQMSLEQIVAAQAAALLRATGSQTQGETGDLQGVDPLASIGGALQGGRGQKLAPLANSFLENVDKMEQAQIEPSEETQELIEQATPVAVAVLMMGNFNGLANAMRREGGQPRPQQNQNGSGLLASGF